MTVWCLCVICLHWMISSWLREISDVIHQAVGWWGELWPSIFANKWYNLCWRKVWQGKTSPTTCLVSQSGVGRDGGNTEHGSAPGLDQQSGIRADQEIKNEGWSRYFNISSYFSSSSPPTLQVSAITVLLLVISGCLHGRSSRGTRNQRRNSRLMKWDKLNTNIQVGRTF